VEHSLEIGYDKEKDCITLKTLKEERFTFYGFGTFLKDVDPKEILISQEALDVLLQLPARGGLNGLEFWPQSSGVDQKILAWGSQAPNFMVGTRHINVPNESKVWLRECTIK